MKVKLAPGAYMPERAHPTDAGLDLRSPVDAIIEPVLVHREPAFYGFQASNSCCAAIDTGVYVEIPHGYYGKIETKSGLNRNHQIVCCGGVIDENYRGPIVVMVYNFSNELYIIKAGDKIAQMVIQPYAAPDMELVTELGDTDRGNAGFGSTGR